MSIHTCIKKRKTWDQGLGYVLSTSTLPRTQGPGKTSDKKEEIFEINQKIQKEKKKKDKKKKKVLREIKVQYYNSIEVRVYIYI